MDSLNSDFHQRVNGLIGACGLGVNSAYRSEALQAELFAAAVSKYGSEDAASHWVARPGQSNHGKGVAVDLAGDLDCAHTRAAEFGLHFPMGWEPWHVEPIGDVTGGAGSGNGDRSGGYTTPPPGATVAPPKPLNYMDTLMSMMGNTRTDPMLSQSNQHANELGGQGVAKPARAASSSTPPGSALSGDVDSWLREAMKLTGVPEDWLPGLRLIAEHESSGDPTSVNNTDSNAQRGDPSRGLMQTIGATFEAHKLPGHDDIFDPVANAAAAIRYIQSRYGSIDQVPGVKSMNAGGSYKPY